MLMTGESENDIILKSDLLITKQVLLMNTKAFTTVAIVKTSAVKTLAKMLLWNIGETPLVN